jgi:hypothetical protein
VASLALQYVRAFPPELSFAEFAPIAAKTFLAETIVVLMFLMPIVTSVVHYHQARAFRRLSVILLAGALSSGVALARLEKSRDPIVSLATRERVRLRTAAAKVRAYDALARALGSAWKALPTAKNDIDVDGKVEGVPLEAARAELLRVYKNDETYAFDLWKTQKGKEQTLVIYFEARGKNPPIWLAMDHPGSTFGVAKRLPRGALLAMKKAADAIDE